MDKTSGYCLPSPQQYDNETFKSRQFRYIVMWIVDGCTAVVNFAMIVVGAIFLNEESCKYSGASLYLLVTGSVGLTIASTKMIVLLTKCQHDDRWRVILQPWIHLVPLALTIWGTVSVLSRCFYF